MRLHVCCSHFISRWSTFVAICIWAHDESDHQALSPSIWPERTVFSLSSQRDETGVILALDLDWRALLSPFLPVFRLQIQSRGGLPFKCCSSSRRTRCWCVDFCNCRSSDKPECDAGVGVCVLLRRWSRPVWNCEMEHFKMENSQQVIFCSPRRTQFGIRKMVVAFGAWISPLRVKFRVQLDAYFNLWLICAQGCPFLAEKCALASLIKFLYMRQIWMFAKSPPVAIKTTSENSRSPHTEAWCVVPCVVANGGAKSWKCGWSVLRTPNSKECFPNVKIHLKKKKKRVVIRC